MPWDPNANLGGDPVIVHRTSPNKAAEVALPFEIFLGFTKGLSTHAGASGLQTGWAVEPGGLPLHRSAGAMLVLTRVWLANHKPA